MNRIDPIVIRKGIGKRRPIYTHVHILAAFLYQRLSPLKPCPSALSFVRLDSSIWNSLQATQDETLEFHLDLPCIAGRRGTRYAPSALLFGAIGEQKQALTV